MHHLSVTGSCITANVGSGESASKTVTIDSATVACPAAVSKRNWLNADTSPDAFEVKQSGNQLTVKRVDVGQGWGMDLRFECCQGIP
jgi:hypothetical protein